MVFDRMEDCFASTKDKVAYALENSDLTKIFTQLAEIKGPTLVCGVGGSSVVAAFMAKVLREKNGIIATFVYPRDLLYMDTSAYENVIAVSYSGNNIGVKVMDDTSLNRYLFTGHERPEYTSIVYRMLKEESYVSINATIVPLSILFLYYRNDCDLLEKLLDRKSAEELKGDLYEVLYGYESSTAAVLLETSLTESGLAACILHEKYNYCHGRINFSTGRDSELIFFRSRSELDDMLEENLPKHYRNIITVNEDDDDPIISDFAACIESFSLIRSLAENKNADISDMEGLEDNDIFYLFNGKMI